MNLQWVMERVERCEKQIWSISKQIVDSGGLVVLDLACTKRDKRALFKKLATDEKIVGQFHFVNATHSLRRERVMERNNSKGDGFSFEVTSGIFDFMEKEFEIPTQSELAEAIIINTDTDQLMSVDK